MPENFMYFAAFHSSGRKLMARYLSLLQLSEENLTIGREGK